MQYFLFFLEASEQITLRFLVLLQRVMILSGPAGSAKTATLRVLSKEMGFQVVEYKTSEGNSGKKLLNWKRRNAGLMYIPQNPSPTSFLPLSIRPLWLHH